MEIIKGSCAAGEKGCSRRGALNLLSISIKLPSTEKKWISGQRKHTFPHWNTFFSLIERLTGTNICFKIFSGHRNYFILIERLVGINVSPKIFSF